MPTVQNEACRERSLPSWTTNAMSNQLTVLIPCRNEEQNIQECIASIASIAGVAHAKISWKKLTITAAKSSVPAIGYAGSYTFANVLLTFAGTLMMRL